MYKQMNFVVERLQLITAIYILQVSNCIRRNICNLPVSDVIKQPIPFCIIRVDGTSDAIKQPIPFVLSVLMVQAML